MKSLYLKVTDYSIDGKQCALEMRYHDGIEVIWARIGLFGFDMARDIQGEGIEWWGGKEPEPEVCKFCKGLRTNPCHKAGNLKANANRFPKSKCAEWAETVEASHPTTRD